MGEREWIQQHPNWQENRDLFWISKGTVRKLSSPGSTADFIWTETQERVWRKNRFDLFLCHAPQHRWSRMEHEERHSCTELHQNVICLLYVLIKGKSLLFFLTQFGNKTRGSARTSVWMIQTLFSFPCLSLLSAFFIFPFSDFSPLLISPGVS